MSEIKPVEILLVEDSDADAEMTLRALKRAKLANQIHRVRDGVEAIEFLFQEGAHAGHSAPLPRLVMLDLKMPRLGGLEVLRRIKQDPRTQSMPVVVMTSSREEGDLLKSYEYGVNSYVVKPVDFEEFAATVGEVGMYWMLANETPQ